MSSRKRRALAGPLGVVVLTVAKRHCLSCGSTPAIKEIVHRTPCSFQDMSYMALFASGRSPMTSSTLAHRAFATSKLLSHTIRM